MCTDSDFKAEVNQLALFAATSPPTPISIPISHGDISHVIFSDAVGFFGAVSVYVVH